MMTLPVSALWKVVPLSILIANSLLAQEDIARDVWRDLQHVPRDSVTAGDHPGNVFLSGERVTIQVPERTACPFRWRAMDDDGTEVARGEVTKSEQRTIELGMLGIGWYRIEWFDSSGEELGWTTAAVLARLAVPTPQDSPICVDSATAWFARDDAQRQDQFSRLAALAGVNWIRDRMRWRDIQKARDLWVAETTYDSAANIQHRYGLKILQVFHDTPKWAVPLPGATGRFPSDLRDVYHFAKAMSTRFQGRVQAWEPWNEANVTTFGGHTIDELCSYQKAAYLGFKAGDSDVTVCWNATTGAPTERQTDGVLLNEVWNYFDTYNIHTYDWSHDYERLWRPARRAACGKPLWITESDRGMTYEPSSATHDLSRENERLKAQYVAQSYATSLSVGANRHFHFILGQYDEGSTQFGLLRHDLTPRSGYVALAALGRLLAGARSLGRYELTDRPDVHIYAFRGHPDGHPRDVLVAWTEQRVDWSARGTASVQWELPQGITPLECYDYLGRFLPHDYSGTLTSAPIYFVLPSSQCDQLTLTRPQLAERQDQSITPVVLQCLMPKESSRKIDRIAWAWEIEHTARPGSEFNVSLVVCNFADHRVRGKVNVENLPAGCQIHPSSWELELTPLQRLELPVKCTISPEMTGQADDNWITLRGDFGSDGRPVLALRIIAAESTERP